MIIQESSSNVKKILGEGKRKPGAVYKKSPLVLRTVASDGTLLFFNGFTEEARTFTEEEAAAFENGDCGDELSDFFIRNHYFVPEDFDERKEVETMRSILKVFTKHSDKMQGFLIFTTTDCNARCFYCYEAGCKREHMSPETAKKTADWIIRNRDPKQPVSLHFFGGEPLYNYGVIDIIIDRLREAGVPYRSGMISNGYLFTEELVGRAKEKWNLTEVQITLDGTEEVYNERKAYIDSEGSAYQRVLRNIGYLLQHQIKVSIRLNMDPDNIENLKELREELYRKFAPSEYLSVYIRMIYSEWDQNTEGVSSPEDVKKYNDMFEFEDDLHRHGYYRGARLSQFRYKLYSCMSTNGVSVGVLPDGTFVNCEHFSESPEIIGDLSKDEVDREKMKILAEKYEPGETCKSCPALLSCHRPRRCPVLHEKCGLLEKRKLLKMAEDALKYTYEDVMKKKAGGSVLEEEIVMESGNL